MGKSKKISLFRAMGWLLACCVCWCSLPYAAAQKESGQVSWLLDPGHGGNSRGAAGGEHQEKEDALRLSLAVGRILEANGQKVGYTRTTDVTLSLEERVDMQKAGGYTYFVSIHRNAANRQATGFEIHTYTEDGWGSEAYTLAQSIRQQLLDAGLVAPAETAGEDAFRDRGIKQSDFHVLRETACPAVLIEAGFIDTEEDNRLFDEHFDELAAGIAAGCLRLVGITDPAQPLPTTGEAEQENGGEPLKWLAIAGAAVLGVLGTACIGFAAWLLLVTRGRRRIRRDRRHGH